MASPAELHGEYPSRPRRNRVLKGGVVSFNGEQSTINCSVCELSETGALLRFTGNVDLPKEFVLHIQMDGVKVPCEWVRNVGNKVAVKFAGEFMQTNDAYHQGLQENIDSTQAPIDRQAEINEIVHNMRQRDFLHQTPKTQLPVRPVRREARAFGKRKYEPKTE